MFPDSFQLDSVITKSVYIRS